MTTYIEQYLIKLFNDLLSKKLRRSEVLNLVTSKLQNTTGLTPLLILGIVGVKS